LVIFATIRRASSSLSGFDRRERRPGAPINVAQNLVLPDTVPSGSTFRLPPFAAGFFVGDFNQYLNFKMR
jgi:hypothetical protein